MRESRIIKHPSEDATLKHLYEKLGEVYQKAVPEKMILKYNPREVEIVYNEQTQGLIAHYRKMIETLLYMHYPELVVMEDRNEKN